MPLWRDQIRGKYGLIESLHLSNKIWRHSDSLEHESVGKSEEISQTECSRTNSPWPGDFFWMISLFSGQEKDNQEFELLCMASADFF